MKENLDKFLTSNSLVVLCNIAVNLYNAGRLNESLEVYYKIIALDCNYYDAISNIGSILDDLGDTEQALLYLNKAKKLEPKNYIAYYYCGWLYRNQKKYNLAIENFIIAIDLEPLHIDSYKCRGGCYYNIGQYDDALKDFSKAINIDPKNPNSFISRARVFAIKKDYKRCITDMRKAMKMQYVDYEPREMVVIVNHDQHSKVKEASGRFLNYGFYLALKGDPREKVIIYPRICKYRIVLQFSKLHIGKTIKRHLRQYAGRYELKFDSDFDIIFTKCQERYRDDYDDVLYMENFRFLFSIINKNNDSPRAIGVGLYLDGKLVAGDIGVQVRQVYTSYSGYHDLSGTGSVQLLMLARYLEENGFVFWDLGSDTISRFERYKYKMGAEKISNAEYQKLFHSVNPGSENIFTKKHRNLGIPEKKSV